MAQSYVVCPVHPNVRSSGPGKCPECGMALLAEGTRVALLRHMLTPLHLSIMAGAMLVIMRHRDGILAWFDSQIANGLIEGINSLIQAAKAKARGYRSTRTLKAITYLIAGKLDLKLPT